MDEMQKNPQPSSSSYSSSSSSSSSDEEYIHSEFRVAHRTKPTLSTKEHAIRAVKSKHATTPTKKKSKRESESTKKLKRMESASDSQPPTKPSAQGPEKKPNLPFQRKWTDADELVVLQGLIAYYEKEKSDSVLDINKFHDLIKNKLHDHFTKSQLQEKIRRLKGKYLNNKNKEKKTFPDSHGEKLYQLSDVIWANVRVESKEDASGGNANANANASASMSDGFGRALTVDFEEKMLKCGRAMFEGAGDPEWERLRKEELQIYIQYLELRTAQANFLMNAIRQT